MIEEKDGNGIVLKSYTYDSFGQLIREDNQALDKTIIYCYDDNIGNIINYHEYDYTLEPITCNCDTATKAYSYDANYPDRLTNFNGKSIIYNSIGYPTNYDGKTWTWNDGKLTRIHKGSESQPGSKYENCTFTYDGYGRRIRKHYVYDPNPAVAGDGHYYYITNYNYDESDRLVKEYITEYRDTGVTTTREMIYLYDASGIIGVSYSVNGGTPATYYYRKNAQGDVTAIYDANGNRRAEYAYDAWGNCKILYGASTLIAGINPIRYRGYYFDREIGLYYLNARYYNPEWRRFISPDDTAYLDPETPNGLNLYAYCNNDPVNYVDPSGCFPVLAVILCAVAVIGMGLTIGGVATDNNILTAVGLGMVGSAAIVSGGIALLGAFATGATLSGIVGGITATTGLGSLGFMSAEVQEATGNGNWIMDTFGMSDVFYNTLLLSTAAIATLGTAASSVAYGFEIKSIQNFGKFRKYGREGYYGMKYTTKTGKTRVLSLHTHSHIPGKTISQWHWQLQKWNPKANEVAGTVSSWNFWTLRKGG